MLWPVEGEAAFGAGLRVCGPDQSFSSSRRHSCYYRLNWRYIDLLDSFSSLELCVDFGCSCGCEESTISRSLNLHSLGAAYLRLRPDRTMSAFDHLTKGSSVLSQDYDCVSIRSCVILGIESAGRSEMALRARSGQSASALFEGHLLPCLQQGPRLCTGTIRFQMIRRT